MTLRNYISAFGLSILCSFFLINGAFANTYTSEIFSSINECNIKKDKNDKLYTNFYRSNCVETSNGKFHYNICDTNYCVASQNTDKLTENKDPGVYQYDSQANSMTIASSDHKLDDETNAKIKRIAEGLENRFQKMSEGDLEKWNDNFDKVIANLSEKSNKNDKNLALINAIKKEVDIIVKKQQQENDLCKSQFGTGWKEASFFFESENMVTWIEGNKKHTLACEYKETIIKIVPETKETQKKEGDKKPVNDSGIIDVYTAPAITDQPEKKELPPIVINQSEEKLDITQPVQGIYRATKKQYTDDQTSRYTGLDICTIEYGLEWQESKERNIDAYIMLYSKYNIETSGYGVYWNGKKLISTPKDKLLHKACVQNTLDTIVNDKYRITQGKYRGNILRDGDICKSEYGNEWKVSKEKIAYTQSFAYHTKAYPNLLAWTLYPNSGSNDCGGHHSNNSWNGTVHRTDNTSRQVNRCSYNPEKIKNAEKYNQHFVCEKEKTSTKDISAVVQGLYKTTSNKYTYKDAYSSDFDICKVEYGRDWKRNVESIDANIMLYSKYSVETWIESGLIWNGEKSVKPSGTVKNHIACIEDIYNYRNENYKELLTPATPEGIENYMNSFEKEILSKVKITNDFIFIDDGFAITQKKYYGNQIYTDKSVCPLGYELQKNRVIGSPKIRYNQYYATILGKYVEKNWDRYYPQQAKSDKIMIPFRTWDKWDDQTVSRNSLEEIKKISQKEKFAVYNVNLGNPSRFMKNSYGVVVNNNYLYHGDGSGNGSVEGPQTTIGTLLPALCVNTKIKLNSSSTSNVENMKSFDALKKIDEKLIINNFKDSGRGPLFFAYEYAKITGFFNHTNYAGVKYIEYFLPIRTGNTLSFIKKKHY